MKSRCKNLTTHNKKSYFDKGITVCDEWANDFLTFQRWAIAHGYKDDLTIDRIDGNKGYSPENCRWATRKQQQNNMSSNTYLTFQGEVHTISEWSDITGLPAYLISSRIRGGWSDEQILTTPINIKMSSKFRNYA